MIDRAELRRLAEAANGDRPADTSGPWPGPQTEEFWSFVAACSPATVLDLLQEIDRLRAIAKKNRDGFEEYERRYYLQLNEIERLREGK